MEISDTNKERKTTRRVNFKFFKDKASELVDEFTNLRGYDCLKTNFLVILFCSETKLSKCIYEVAI